eukprot:TRINITY_DN8261_c0_g1_i5.p1 TRINITY_DN8261_c0_g1~~TRINITY_DN8261_c0_g1_i5.p1  ORF type:complete len:122 (-),score=6.90 TRINITY_DN8261_c0_g1_i5:63-428(-)
MGNRVQECDRKSGGGFSGFFFFLLTEYYQCQVFIKVHGVLSSTSGNQVFFFSLTLRCGLVCPLNLYAFTPKVWPLLIVNGIQSEAGIHKGARGLVVYFWELGIIFQKQGIEIETTADNKIE